MTDGLGGPMVIGASDRGDLGTAPTNRGDLGTAPIYIIGGVILVVGLVLIILAQVYDLGLMISGAGLVLIGVQEKPKLNFKWVKYTGPPGLVLMLAGILIFIHVL